MADKSVGELIAATSVTPTDLFVLEQNGTAKKLTGQILENWLVSFADGHGGIQSIVKKSTSGLVDTYRITLSDTTTFDFLVTNGRDVRSITKTGTSGLVDTYTIRYNDSTSDTLTVTNGAKGDKGDNQYVWIKYASQKPTASSHSFGDVADNWIGIYSGASKTAPTDWTQYEWFQIKGEKGDAGDPARLNSSAVEYQVSNSGTIIPSGTWSASVPVVAQGKYLWTRITQNFNTGNPVISYSVSRMGLDGSGSVSSVANISPDVNGNVPLTAADLNALSNTGGDLTGELRMNGQPISGLNPPTSDTQAANMGFVNQQVKKAAPRNLLDNSDFTNPVNQRGKKSYSEKGYYLDRWLCNNTRTTVTINDGYINIAASSEGNGYLRQTLPKDLDGIYTLAICARGTGQGQIYSSRDTKANDKLVFTTTSDWAVYTLVVDTSDTEYVPNQVSIAAVKSENIDVKWIALYEGEYTAETLPKYQPKGYAAELAECQRYYYRITASWKWITMGICISETQAMFTFKFPQPMRAYPTPNTPDPSLILVRCGTGSTQTPTALAWEHASDFYDIFQLEATVSGAGRGDVAGLYFDDEGVIEFSADFPGGL